MKIYQAAILLTMSLCGSASSANNTTVPSGDADPTPANSVITAAAAAAAAGESSYCMNGESSDGATAACTQPKEATINVDGSVSLTQEAVQVEVEVKPDSEPLIKSVAFPKMPPKIRAILHQDWNVLDPQGEEMVKTMSNHEGAVEFAHARSTFYNHLKGTFSILAAWDQPEALTRTGLVHTAYSGDLFQFFLFDANKDEERAELRGILGEEAEALTYLFGTINRGVLCHFKNVVNRLRPDALCTGENMTVHHRTVKGELEVTPQDAASILMVTIADYLDQMVDTNGWRDHHQMEDGGSQLYPGDGRPALGFYWFSSVCFGIKDYLEVVPSIFNYCQDVLSVEDEEKARDAYWKVATQEKFLTEEQQIGLLNDTVSLNSFVGEPHMMLAQIYFRQGKYYEAALEAHQALEKFYTLASCWDKRRSFEYWVGQGRVILLRANRKLEEEECSFPCVDPHNPLYVNYNDLKLTSLRETVKEMRAREEK